MRISGIIVLLIASLCSYGQKHQLAIIFKGIEYPQGRLMLKIVSDEGKTVAANGIAVDTAGDVVFKIDIPTGRFAVSAFYDQNKNGSLDESTIGVPSEKYGFSNNVKSSLGRPSLEEQLFFIDRDMEITINLE